MASVVICGCILLLYAHCSVVVLDVAHHEAPAQNLPTGINFACVDIPKSVALPFTISQALNRTPSSQGFKSKLSLLTSASASAIDECLF